MAVNEIKAVLSALDYGKQMEERLNNAFAPAKVYHCSFSDTEGIRSVIDDVDVALVPSDLDDRILEGKRLKWIRCCHAGLTKSARKEIFDRGIMLSGSAGRSAASLAEHVFFFALALTYDVYRLKEAQLEHNWSRFSKQYSTSRGLNGQTIGIIGLGNTGRAVAKRAKAFEMNVIAYSRTSRDVLPENVDEFFAGDRGDSMDRLLSECDFLVICCHLSDETYHMIGKDELVKMKKSAVLINMARGAVVEQTAFYDALKNNIIAGAGCDVFDPEPLPADSPFWDLPNLIITPHATPRVPNLQESSTLALFENIEKYRNGEPLVNQMTKRDMFTK